MLRDTSQPSRMKVSLIEEAGVRPVSYTSVDLKRGTLWYEGRTNKYSVGVA